MIRASYSFADVRAEATLVGASLSSGIDFVSAEADYEHTKASLQVNFSEVQGSISFVNIKSVANFIRLSADFDLIAQPINQYLVDSMLVSESSVMSFLKRPQDSFVVFEISSKSLQKPLIENISLGDVFTSQMEFNRGLAHSLSVDDVPSFTTLKKLDDTLLVSEVSTISSSLSRNEELSITDNFTSEFSEDRLLSESASITESHSATFGKSLLDSVAFSDEEAKQFSKTLSDAFALNESALVGSGSTQNPTNVVFASDALSFAASKSVADTLIMQEQLAKQFSTSFDDSTSVTESISVVLISGSNSLFNGGVFNAFAFNE